MKLLKPNSNGKLPKLVRIDQPAFRVWTTLILHHKGGLMDGRSFQISCVLCGLPLTLHIDLSADEKGKAVHEQCYVKRLQVPRSILSAAWPLTTVKPYNYGNGFPTLRQAG